MFMTLLGRFKSDMYDVTLKVMEVGLIKMTISDHYGKPILSQNFNDQKIAIQSFENLLDVVDGQRIN